ncbi:MAG: (deoxy)nucleoside triphosphate pyrophosphohydrolase [Bacteroidales bacterium]|nr:(deoxy)nucleoside triphosphate pyrophosphohydrolase [Bacteroidales bacterium]
MIEVTCSIIEKDGKVLATRRASGSHLAGLWEFPGGKIEPGETDEECIIREILEELNLNIEIIGKLQPVEHLYSDKSIRLIPFICKLSSGQLTLKDHSEYRWLGINELQSLDWAEADIKVVIEYLNISKA